MCNSPDSWSKERGLRKRGVLGGERGSKDIPRPVAMLALFLCARAGGRSSKASGVDSLCVPVSVSI